LLWLIKLQLEHLGKFELLLTSNKTNNKTVLSYIYSMWSVSSGIFYKKKTKSMKPTGLGF